MRYNEKIAAQVAAYFIHLEGGSLNIMKLIKLMYLAERESLEQYGEPMIGDTLASMPHGPVVSITLDHINAFIQSEEGGWDDWITDRSNHNVSLKTEGDPTDRLLELSEADLNIINITYAKFGYMNQYQIRDYTHDHCGEWENPEGSSSSIPYDRLLKNVGYSPEIASQISQQINEQSELDNLLSITG